MSRCLKRKEAAAELGISRQRLEKLIQQGRIEETTEGIDIEKAKAARARDVDVIRQASYRQSQVGQVQRPVGKVEVEIAGELFDYAKARAEKERGESARIGLLGSEK